MNTAAESNIGVFMGSFYCPFNPPHGWGIVVGDTYVVLSKTTPVVTNKEGVLEHLGEFVDSLEENAHVYPVHHALMDASCVHWMLERAEPLLHSTPLQHIRDRLAACPAGRAMTLSTVWDDMRYVAMFSNFKQKYDEASGTSLKDVPYRAVVAYVEDQADYLLEEHACIDVCDMLNEFFGILVERPESHKHISSVDVDALRAAYQGDVPYEAGRTFEMWKVLAPLYGF